VRDWHHASVEQRGRTMQFWAQSEFPAGIFQHGEALQQKQL